MHLSPNICTVLVCLQLWAIHGQADLQLAKTVARLKRSLPEATRRNGRDLSVKSNIFPVTVDLTTILNDINTRFQALSQSQAQMETQISGMEATIEELESDIEEAKAQISEQSTNIEELTQDLNERNEEINGLDQSLRDTKFAGMFTYVSSKATYAVAEEVCVKQGGHLASLDTDAKLEYVKEHLMQGDEKVWLGAECVGCSVVNEDKWQWKSGSKLSLDHPLWEKNHSYILFRKDLPYDPFGDDAMQLTMRCDGDCVFVNHAPSKSFAYICEKSSE